MIETTIIRKHSETDKALAVDAERTISNDRFRMVGVREADIEAIQVCYGTVEGSDPNGNPGTEDSTIPVTVLTIDIMFKDKAKVMSLMSQIVRPPPSKIIQP